MFNESVKKNDTVGKVEGKTSEENTESNTDSPLQNAGNSVNVNGNIVYYGCTIIQKSDSTK